MIYTLEKKDFSNYIVGNYRILLRLW